MELSSWHTILLPTQGWFHIPGGRGLEMRRAEIRYGENINGHAWRPFPKPAWSIHPREGARQCPCGGSYV
jgi:hypothetical protein